MKACIVFCLIAVVAVAHARPEDKYTDKYDNVNVDEVLANDRIFKSYFDCIMEKGKCTPEAKELKEHIIEGLQNNCGKCTEAQKNGTRKVMTHLVNKKPEEWKELCDKYDPDRKFTQKYEKELKEIKE